MVLKKNDISLGCENCVCVSEESLDAFDISVPVRDAKTGVNGTAKIHCAISSTGHHLALKEWQDENLQQIHPSDDMQLRLDELLEFVEDRKLCGNCSICPNEIVQIAKKHLEQ